MTNCKQFCRFVSGHTIPYITSDIICYGYYIRYYMLVWCVKTKQFLLLCILPPHNTLYSYITCWCGVWKQCEEFSPDWPLLRAPPVRIKVLSSSCVCVISLLMLALSCSPYTCVCCGWVWGTLGWAIITDIVPIITICLCHCPPAQASVLQAWCL